MMPGRPPLRPAARTPFHRLAELLGGALLLLLALPVAALVAANGPRSLLASWASPAVGRALGLSLTTTSVSLLLIVVTGTPLAWLFARSPRRPTWAEGLVELPIVLPPAVVGVALLTAFGRQGPLSFLWGPWGGSLAFTTAAVVIAQVVVAAPFYVRAATTAFRGLDPDLLLVARTLGASPTRVFFRVAVPLALPGLGGGAGLAWARALGEFGATLLFAGSLPGRTQTLPLAIYAALEVNVQVAQGTSLLLVLVAFGVLFLVRWGDRSAGAGVRPGGDAAG